MAPRQILFVHPNFPAQFGPALSRLSQRGDLECVFATRHPGESMPGVRCIPYDPRGGATRATHYCSRTFENAIWHTHAVYEACRRARGLAPDLIVGHSGFGTTLFLRELYDCPILGFFEYFYHPHANDMDFRPEFPARPIDHLRVRARNATLLLDLHECDAGYTPTRWQHSLLPAEYRDQVSIVHDGIDTGFWRRREGAREIAGEAVAPGTHIVTFCARGLEAMRGFDVFVRVAERIARALPDVLFVVVGEDRVHYGNDERFTGGRSFRDWVLERERPDLERFRFLGRVPPDTLAEIFSVSDLHLYPSVPFVLSWSLLDAMACECVVLAADVAPVREVVTHEETGLLVDFFDEDEMASRALEVLSDPERFRPLGRAAREAILRERSLDAVYPQLEALYLRMLKAD